jgi:hypothetical protein
MQLRAQDVIRPISRFGKILRKLGLSTGPTAHGQASLFHEGSTPPRFGDNTVLYDWASIMTGLMLGRIEYRVAGMYLEFQNVASPGDPADIPLYDRSGAAQYYAGLSSSPDKDYLRVPLTAANVSNSDSDKFSLGDTMEFYAVSSGSVGVHGKAFSSSANSTIFGVVLAAFVDSGDASRDILMSRFYPDESEQILKTDGRQVAALYRFRFG